MNAYGRQLQTFLNAWAAAKHLKISFEVLNAARQGLGPDDSVPIIRYELAPMGLDYVYAYFAPLFAVSGQTISFLKFDAPASSAPTDERPLPVWATLVARLLRPASAISAFASSIEQRLSNESANAILDEPPKPKATLRLPPGVHPHSVDLRYAKQAPYFGDLLDTLDKFDDESTKAGARLIVSRERVCAWDGLRLNKSQNRLLYDYLNGPVFWPARYADIRRILDAHNTTIETWARSRDVSVADIDGKYPRDPELCGDAFHDYELGMRLRAWLIFEALLPLVEKDLAAGTIPHHNAIPSGVNPAFREPMQVLDRVALLHRMQAEAAADKARQAEAH
jgi:hypothetical protein